MSAALKAENDKDLEKALSELDNADPIEWLPCEEGDNMVWNPVTRRRHELMS